MDPAGYFDGPTQRSSIAAASQTPRRCSPSPSRTTAPASAAGARAPVRERFTTKVPDRGTGLGLSIVSASSRKRTAPSLSRQNRAPDRPSRLPADSGTGGKREQLSDLGALPPDHRHCSQVANALRADQQRRRGDVEQHTPEGAGMAASGNLAGPRDESG